MERHCESVHFSVEELSTFSKPCIDDHHFTKDDIEIVGELADTCAQIVFLKNSILRTNRSIRHFVDRQKSISSSCHKVKRSVCQKVGETDKSSRLHFESSTILSCWGQKPVIAS